MSEILKFKEPTLDVPGKPNKNWRLAFATIYSARALYSLLNQNKKKEKSRKLSLPISSTPSYVVLNVKPEAFSSIDRTTLTAIVKEKNLDLLLEFGGIEGVADALQTDIKNGITTMFTMLLSDTKLSVQTQYSRGHMLLKACSTSWWKLLRISPFSYFYSVQRSLSVSESKSMV